MMFFMQDDEPHKNPKPLKGMLVLIWNMFCGWKHKNVILHYIHIPAIYPDLSEGGLGFFCQHGTLNTERSLQTFKPFKPNYLQNTEHGTLNAEHSSNSSNSSNFQTLQTLQTLSLFGIGSEGVQRGFSEGSVRVQ